MGDCPQFDDMTAAILHYSGRVYLMKTNSPVRPPRRNQQTSGANLRQCQPANKSAERAFSRNRRLRDSRVLPFTTICRHLPSNMVVLATPVLAAQTALCLIQGCGVH
jgi:hypothetical protein